jgi:putative AdoMet-dependent methyltransferase
MHDTGEIKNNSIDKDEKMSEYPSWQYDEMKQIGKDYNDLAEVEAYDTRHGKFRNVEKENELILESLRVKPEHVLIDLGTGTGAFALQAARHCAKVYAVDVSRVMLEYAKRKAEKAGVSNIVFCHGGFLTYSHAAPPVDACVTNTAFHHIPDFWKGIALQRLNRMLKDGGQLYLSDVIFEDKNVLENISRFIAKLEKVAGSDIRADVEAHVRKEFSTYDWIMDGLLERAHFRITSKVLRDGVIGRYVCKKEREARP